MSVAFARRFFSAFCLFGLVWFAGCKHESPPPVARAIDFRQPLPDGMVALRKIDPSEYPNFAEQPIDPAAAADGRSTTVWNIWPRQAASGSFHISISLTIAAGRHAA